MPWSKMPLMTGISLLALLPLACRWNPFESGSLLPANPCAPGVVTAERLPDSPVILRISDTGCETSGTANVIFQAMNRSGKVICRVEVRALWDFGGRKDLGSSGVDTPKILNPGESFTGFIGGGVAPESSFIPGDLTEFRLVVWSVTFADGSVWQRPVA